MFGNFQQSHLRIEVNANAQTIADSLLNTAQLRQWLLPQVLSPDLPDKLATGLKFTSWTGPVPVQHYVNEVGDRNLGLILSKGIDGYHQWSWGDGWLQSRLEGISLLPLNLGQTASLLRLRLYLGAKTVKSTTAI
ncbi:MAG: hypothetical protein N5P05_000449 [Chroococcopsis gigantea SAG 12.99]|jgi:hypothetical protein|nr:hypothetical protein [Chroococcopsis gigantea SAG 12.99]